MTEAAKTYSIQRLNIDNIADLAKLHTAVYGRKPEPWFFQKKYDTVYTGAQFIGFIAYNLQNLPIAFYGVIPTMLWYNGRTILAAQSADTMTHPDYRRMGLFVELANYTYDLCKTENIQVLFGFPNQNSRPGLINKLNWYSSQIMERFHIQVKANIPLEKIARKYPVLKPCYQRYQNRVLRNYLTAKPGIANSVLLDGSDGVYRDAKYLNYKTYSDTFVIQISQSLFWIKLQNGLHIGDIENVGSDFEFTLKTLIKLARKMGIAEIHFQASPQTQLYSLFAKYYPAHPSYHIGFRNLDANIATENIKFTFADIDIF